MSRFSSVAFLLLAWLAPLCASAQETTLAIRDRGPHFLVASSPSETPIPVDIARTPVLIRRVSVDFENVPLDHALKRVAALAGFKLSYSTAVIPYDRPVHLKAADITVVAALTELLVDAQVDVLFSTSAQAVLVPQQVGRKAVPLQVGAMVGRVTDVKTQTALAGATVLVLGTSRSATTGTDGRYRIADVAPGTYTVRARYIGYAPGAASVTVRADQEATADFALEKSAQRLDEVVTTGTVVPTEVKALPTPISVITADEIQQKGYQRLDQIFRGDVPGAIAWDNGAVNYYSDIKVRGASSLFSSNNLKTYVDGVEIADPTYLSTIDPSSIERIEILRGPQGSTLYGSQALAGVMQIVTKKGAVNTLRPEVQAKVSAGVIQSQWDHTVQQDHSLAVTGGGKDFSYRVGGGYLRSGAWVPGVYTHNVSLDGGLRGTQGPVTVELSAHYFDKAFAYPVNPAVQIYPPFSNFDQSDALQQQTYGLTFKYAATAHWQHNLVLGYDRNAFGFYLNHPQFTTPADSFLQVYNLDETKASVAYNTTYAVPLGRAVQSSLTAGVDHWRLHVDGFYASSTTSNSNTIPSPNFGTRSQYDNTGYFAQAQLGLWDAVFLTAGLRAEDNTNFGQDYGLAWTPRVGASYVHTFGTLTAKTRVAYGRAIRPPDPGLAQAVVTSFAQQRANPNLGPEQQRGWDGGLELYFGQWVSLEANYYNQTAVDLIDNVALGFLPVYIYQAQNVGTIKNKGWEFQARLTADRLSLTGTFSITGSVVQTLSPTYTAGDLQPGDQMLGIPKHTAGATLAYSLPRTTVTFGMTYVGSWINSDYLALYGYYYGGQPYRGSRRDYWITYPSFAKLNLSLSQTVTDQLSVFLRSDNLTNNNISERSNFNINSGRVTIVGVRAKL